MTTYRYKNYSADVAGDGQILVKPNDWLSKYYACIHQRDVGPKDLPAIKREFGRMIGNGQDVPDVQSFEVQGDPHLIYAGETVYHIPTFLKNKPYVRGSIRNPIFVTASGLGLGEWILSRLIDLAEMIGSRSPGIITPHAPSTQTVIAHIEETVKPGEAFCLLEDPQSVWYFDKTPTGKKVFIPVSPRAHQQFKEAHGTSWDDFRRQHCHELGYCRAADSWYVE